MDKKQTLIKGSVRSSFVGIVLLFAILPLLASCSIKKAEVNEQTFGPEATQQELQAILAKALAGQPPLEDRRTGDAIHYEVNLRVNNSSVIKLADVITGVVGCQVIPVPQNNEGVEITTCEDYHNGPRSDETPESYTINFRETQISYDTDGELIEEVSRDYDATIVTNPTPPLDPLSLTAFNITNLFPSFMQKTTQQQKYIKFSFHNLQNRVYQSEPPAKIRDSENCRGLNPCQITVTEVSYEVVLWKSDTAFDKQIITLKLSNDIPSFGSPYETPISDMIPLLGTLLSQCIYQRLDDDNGGTYFINQCAVLRDFVTSHGEN